MESSTDGPGLMERPDLVHARLHQSRHDSGYSFGLRTQACLSLAGLLLGVVMPVIELPPPPFIAERTAFVRVASYGMPPSVGGVELLAPS